MHGRPSMLSGRAPRLTPCASAEQQASSSSHAVLLGWPRAVARRCRLPARELAPEEREAPRLTPRQKYGLPSLGQLAALPAPAPRLPAPPVVRPKPPTPHEFYAAVAAGQWHSVNGAAADQAGRQIGARAGSGSSGGGAPDPPPSRPLFGPPQPPQQRATPGLRRKVAPAIRNALRWTKLQRRVLPRYLLVLDEGLASLLLDRLVALQPPGPARPQPGTSSVPSATDDATRTAAGSGVVAAGGSGGEAAEPAAGEAEEAARRRGFRSAAHERAEFELMLGAVCVALRPKLRGYSSRGLAALAQHLAGLRFAAGETFWQAWCDAWLAAPDRPPLYRAVNCLAAMAATGQLPPARWLAAFWDAALVGTRGLPPQHLCRLLRAVEALQLRPQDAWWPACYGAVRRQLRVAAQQGGVGSGAAAGAARREPAMLTAGHVLAALAACTQAPLPSPAWWAWCEQLLLAEAAVGGCTPAAAAEVLGALAALQLRAQHASPPQATPAGALQPAQTAAAAEEAATDVASGREAPGQQLRVGTQLVDACAAAMLCAPLDGAPASGAAPPLLATCEALHQLGWQPGGAWLGALEASTQRQMGGMAAAQLLATLDALAAWHHAPGAAWFAAFALASHAQLQHLELRQLQRMAEALQRLGARMPAQWLLAFFERAAAAASGAGGAAQPAASALQQLMQASAGLHPDLEAVLLLRPGLRERLVAGAGPATLAGAPLAGTSR